MYAKRTGTKRTYKKRYTKKKSNTSWYNKRYSPLQIAQQALAGVKAIRGIINSEKHIYDASPLFSGQITSSVSTVSSNLTNITVGDLNANRTGLSVLAKSASVKGYISYPSGTTGTRVTMMIVRDDQQVADTNPLWSDIHSGDINGFLNPNSVGRFTILKKQTFEQDTGIPEIHIDMFVPLDHHVRFNGSTGTDIQKGGVFLVMISNKVAGVTAPTAALNGRLTYYDN